MQNYKAYKIEIKPTEQQIVKINKTFGVCRFIYNFYITRNKEIYEQKKCFIGAYEFSKWLNNTFIKENPTYSWIKEVSSKAIKKAISDGETSFKKFFNYKSSFPKYKKKTNNVKFTVFKDGPTNCTVERHRIKIPTLGFVRLKEFGYCPNNSNVKSMTISKEANRYFVSILCEIEKQNSMQTVKNINGIGIDLGIKHFAVCSNDQYFNNVNKTSRIKRIEKKLKNAQRSLSRKSNKKGESNKNRLKSILLIQKLHRSLHNKRTEYVRFVINSLVKQNPQFIAIEDLNIKQMLKNKYLSKQIQNQMFYYFRVFLLQQCKKRQIEVRIVNRFYPSSKICCCCGLIKKKISLNERMFICNDCGLEIDRDLNAAYNIRDCLEYNTVG